MKLDSLEHVFEVTQGNKLDLNKMTLSCLNSDSVSFIGRSAERNGVVATVKKLDSIDPHESGLITVALGGSALSSFVQPRPFYTAQNVAVLRPRKRMSLDKKIYYCLCIEANQFRYSTYGREANRTLKHLAVPALKEVPSWVEGSSETAVLELCSNLQGLIATTSKNADI